MRIVLAGTRSFGVAALERLLALDSYHEVLSVVAPPGDALEAFARSRRLLVRNELHYRDLEHSTPDLIVGAHMHQFVGKRSRAAAKHGALIGHPSLLPRHRGKSAVEWTVRMRDPVAGFTWFMADSGVDTGPVVAQDWCHVRPGWNASDLWRERLFPMGIKLLMAAIGRVELDYAVPQDPAFATWEPALDNVPSLHRPELDAISATRWTEPLVT